MTEVGDEKIKFRDLDDTEIDFEDRVYNERAVRQFYFEYF